MKATTEMNVARNCQVFVILGTLLCLAGIWHFIGFAMFAAIAFIAVPGMIASTVLTTRQIRAMA